MSLTRVSGKVLNTSVATIGDLPTTGYEGQAIIVNHFYSDVDGGGGTFIWANEDKSTHNGGTIIDPATTVTPGATGWWTATGGATLGVWKRQYDGAVNVKWFGARGDGVTDDTIAISNCCLLKGHVCMPRGVYNVSGLHLQNLDDFILFGEGELFLIDNANTPVIKLTDCSNFEINGLSINGNKSNQVYNDNRNDYAGISILGNSTSRFRVIDNRIHNNLAGAGLLTITGGSNQSRGYIAGNRIYDVGTATYLSDGMFINSGWTTVENNYIDNTSDYGIAADYSEKFTIKNNKLYNTLVGIGVLGANYWEVSGNTVDTSGLGIAVSLIGNSAVEPYISHDVLIKNNFIANITRAASGTPNGDGIFVNPSADNISIIGNIIKDAYRSIGSDSPNVVCEHNITNNGIYCSNSKFINNNIGSYLVNTPNVSFALPYFYFGDSGIDDEYLLLCKAGVHGFGVQGELLSSKGSSDTHGSINIGIKSAVAQVAFVTKFEINAYVPDFEKIEILTVNGVEYAALKARASGGTNNFAINFTGLITGTDALALTRVRLSDAGVSLTTADFSFHGGISKLDYNGTQTPTYITNKTLQLGIDGTNSVVRATVDNAVSLGTGAYRWESVFAKYFKPATGDTLRWEAGVGSPEGAIAADVGSLYTRIDGGVGTTLYVKESGTNTTGWVAK